MNKFNTIEEALDDIKAGKMIIVVDDEDRENEGDLLMAADTVTEEAINFMTKYGRGLICMPATKKILYDLQIFPMVHNNTDVMKTAFTVSIDHKDTTTGISAKERALTIKSVLSSTSPLDFNRPGHIFPLVAKEGGVLERNGHTEAAVDLARLAGFKSAGVIVEIMNEDGSMSRVDDLMKMKEVHNLKIITIEDLITYRKSTEINVIKEEEVDLPTANGHFRIQGFVDSITNEHHVALIKGDVTKNKPILTRIHSECLTGDVFSSKRCDCKDQLDIAIKAVEKEGCGVVLYLRQEGRGIGLINKLKAYKLQEEGLDTVDANIKLGFKADLRDFSIAAQIYKSLGVKTIDIMSNNPKKLEELEMYGININKRIHIEPNHNEVNEFYLKTKKEKMNHLLK